MPIINARRIAGFNILKVLKPEDFIIINSLSFASLLYTKIQARLNVKGVIEGIIVGNNNEVIAIKSLKSSPLVVTYSINFNEIISHIKLIKKI